MAKRTGTKEQDNQTRREKHKPLRLATALQPPLHHIRQKERGKKRKYHHPSITPHSACRTEPNRTIGGSITERILPHHPVSPTHSARGTGHTGVYHRDGCSESHGGVVVNAYQPRHGQCIQNNSLYPRRTVT
jgi:hypothetical protein